jgi:hypothetical protein
MAFIKRTDFLTGSSPMLLISFWLLFATSLLSSCSAVPLPETIDSPTSPPADTTAVTVQDKQQVTLQPSIRTTPTRNTPTPNLTPSPETTPEPTRTPSLTATSPLQGTPQELPEQSSELLFINKSGLMRWDYVTNYVTPISDSVIDYSVNHDGRSIAMLRSTNMVANGIELYELVMFDYDTKQIRPILENTPRLFSISLSPDGRWVAYYPQENGGRLKVISTGNKDEEIELGFCHQALGNICDAVSWSPDSRKVLWSDQRGLWLSTLAESSQSLITPNTLKTTDPDGETSEIQVSYSDLKWSPAGRFALVKVIPSSSATHWYTIIDTSRENIIEVPDTFLPGTDISNTIWLDNGDLIVAGLTKESGIYQINTAIFEIIPTHNNLVRYKETLEFSSEVLSNIIIGQEAFENLYLNWIDQSNHQVKKVNLAVISREHNILPTLFQLDLEDESLEAINMIQTPISDLYWAKDNNGALMTSEDDKLFFIPINGRATLNITQILGTDAAWFTWLPPTSR